MRSFLFVCFICAQFLWGSVEKSVAIDCTGYDGSDVWEFVVSPTCTLKIEYCWRIPLGGTEPEVKFTNMILENANGIPNCFSGLNPNQVFDMFKAEFLADAYTKVTGTSIPPCPSTVAVLKFTQATCRSQWFPVAWNGPNGEPFFKLKSVPCVEHALCITSYSICWQSGPSGGTSGGPVITYINHITVPGACPSTVQVEVGELQQRTVECLPIICGQP